MHRQLKTGKMRTEMNLTDISVGQVVIIREFLDENFKMVLTERLFMIGEKVVVKSKAPLGCPIIIENDGYQIAIRISDAKNILVSLH